VMCGLACLTMLSVPAVLLSGSPVSVPLFYKRVREWVIPLPPRCRQRVNSLYLPACPVRAPGDPIASAS
jgi:hypothetical protein